MRGNWERCGGRKLGLQTQKDRKRTSFQTWLHNLNPQRLQRQLRESLGWGPVWLGRCLNETEHSQGQCHTNETQRKARESYSRLWEIFLGWGKGWGSRERNHLMLWKEPSLILCNKKYNTHLQLAAHLFLQYWQCYSYCILWNNVLA